MRVATLFFSAGASVLEDAEAALRQGHEVYTAGFAVTGAATVASGWGAAVREVLQRTSAEALAVQAPTSALPALLAPLAEDAADVVVGHRAAPPLLERPLNHLARLALEEDVADPLCASLAFRVEALREELPRADGLEAEPEALVRLAAQHHRFAEAPVPQAPPRPALHLARLARAWGAYATVRNDTDNEHEGYTTLAHFESGAPNYNRWLAKSFERWAGRRVLEIGAGIGTMTAQLAPGRELVTALEVDPFYVRRLRNRFRHVTNVEPLLGDVAMADWEALRARRFDTILLSNVLEHIPDDAGAVETFGRILGPGGRLLLFVPALPALFGAIDEAVGHHRRYTPATLRAVLEGHGFDVEHLRWMNAVGIPGWYVNGTVLRRRVVPPLQLRLYDRLAPALAAAEARLHLPVGLSLLAVGRRRA